MSSIERVRKIHADLAIKQSMEVRREEFLDYMTFRRNERPLFTELFGPLVGLKEEWAAQGASSEERDLSAFRYRRHMVGAVPVNTGWLGGFTEEVIEETDEHILARDAMGRTTRLVKGAASLPHPLDYPVRTMADWRRIRPHFEFAPERMGEGWREIACNHLEEGRVVAVSIPGGFDAPRELMGEENVCMAFYTQPELIHDILKTIGDTAFRVLDEVSGAVQIDELFVHEDMAGKTGPLVGPAIIEEFIKPYYRRIWDLLQSRGARLFVQDSDGNMNAVIPAFLESGINVMYPMEPAAGMDIVRLRETYGQRLAFMGGIDKHCLRQSKEAIIAELEYKIPPMVRTGGCVLGLDHRIPNGTPIAHYRFYIEKVWEIMDREAGKL